MAQLFDIKKVTVGPRALTALVELAPSAPLRTSDDPAGTERVRSIMPELADHVCLGDSAPRFRDVIDDTELAHLLEHVSVEILARTDIAGDIACGQTVQVGERTFEITLACPDDVLVAGAISSAVWVLQWAYSGGGEPEPDIDATASGLVDLVASLDGPSATDEREPMPQPASHEASPDESTKMSSEPAPEPAHRQDSDDAAPAAPEGQARTTPSAGPSSEDGATGLTGEGAPGPADQTAPAPRPAPAQDKNVSWGAPDVPPPRSVR